MTTQEIDRDLIRPLSRPLVRGAVDAASAYLDGVLDSVVAEWQATEYSGTGNLLNLAASPADSSAQSDNDLVITGATFDTDKFTLDGSDWFKYVTSTDFLNSLHKTTGGPDFTLIIALQLATISVSTQCLMSNHAGGADAGVRLIDNGATDVASLIQRSGTITSANSTGTIPNATDVIVMASHSHSTNKTRIWIGSATGEELDHTFGTTTTDPTGPFTIGAESDNGFPVLNGGVFYGAAILNEYIDNTKAAEVISYFETATGRDLTP